MFAAPEIRERGRLSGIPAASGDGTVPNIAPPFDFRDTPIVDPVAAPMLGQHTGAVLSQALGLDQAALEALKRAGVIDGRI